MAKSEIAKTGQIAPPVTYFTYDEERVEHIISDDKLMLVANGGKDISFDICICAFGIALGYAQNFVNVVTNVKAGIPVDPWQGFGSAIFLAAAAVFTLTALHHKRSSTNVSELLTQIKSRKVGVMGEAPFVGGQPFAPDPSKDTSSTTG
ncbi:hypothetical protein [Allomesorhizobium camelthorni]|uniref:Uncharacterized protein n=1 Tax=Allomesorhizobium camelthorni TaxID=475069 RepID=A0A6G4WAK2_9HYPH|nr:hypothetical protein [Mesorhizobium camelthorni]NGO51629.1 hypothetical protein [Mesorhizobium camelthorni]